MKRMKKLNRTAAFLAAVILTVLCMSQAVFAAGEAGSYADEPVTFTIDLESQSKQVTVSLCPVGSWDEEKEAWVLTGDFASSGVELGKLTADDVRTASPKLRQYVTEQKIDPLATQTTSQGKTQFTGLTPGLYLVYQGSGTGDNVTMSPFLATLPLWDEEAHFWNYIITSRPKNSTPSTNPDNPRNPGRRPSRDPNNPGNPGTPGNPGDPDVPLADIPDDGVPQTNLDIIDEDVPLANIPLLETIEDLLTPLAALPRTADSSMTYSTLLAMLAVSGMGILLVGYQRRKEMR